MTAATTRQPNGNNNVELALERIEHKVEMVKLELGTLKNSQELGTRLIQERLTIQEQQGKEQLNQLRREFDLRFANIEKDILEQKESIVCVQEEMKLMREVATQFRFMAGLGGGGGMIGLIIGIYTLAKAFTGN